MSNNVIVLGPPHSGKIRIAQHVTQDFDSSTIQPDSHSGLIYNFRLSTKYFSSNVNLLVEEYPDSRCSNDSLASSLRSFYDEIASPDYAELREVLDGIVFTIDIDTDTKILSELLDIFTKIKDLLEDNDIFSVVVCNATPDQKAKRDAIEDEVISYGFEFLDFSEEGRNEYFENLGKDRLIEIFETHEWSQVENPMSDETYAKHKTEKMGSMTQPLLEGENNDIGKTFDFDELFAKLKLDRQRAEGMSQEEKKSFVYDLVDDYMEYF